MTRISEQDALKAQQPSGQLLGTVRQPAEADQRIETVERDLMLHYLGLGVDFRRDGYHRGGIRHSGGPED